MLTKVVAKLLICLSVFGLCLYSYIDKQNKVTQLRIKIPMLSKEIKMIQEENIRLGYEIDRFESPSHLMELARSHEFRHLKHPYLKEVTTMKQGLALKKREDIKDYTTEYRPKFNIAIGAK